MLSSYQIWKETKRILQFKNLRRHEVIADWVLVCDDKTKLNKKGVLPKHQEVGPFKF
jgi:hypothetical protein